jgi:hypothetical protein
MRKMLLTWVGIVAWTSAQTCDCDYAGNFLTISKNADAIFIVRVDGYNDFFSWLWTNGNPESATFEVIKTLKGFADEKEIKVFGDNGMLCRPYIDTFKKDRYYVVALYQCSENREGETTEDFLISACGEYWLDYNSTSKIITGLITPGTSKPSTLKLEAFEKLLKASLR